MLLSLSDFDLISADTVAEACSLLGRYGKEARLFAGGTDLLVKMKHKRSAPRYLIDIKRIPGLDRIRCSAQQGLSIGALATIQSIKDSPIVARECPLLTQVAGKMGTVHIRNLGTLGGNLANASPSAEFAPALLCLEASAHCVGGGGERLVPVRDFFVGPGRNALQQDEMLTEVRVPQLPAQAAGVYLKQSLRRMDVAIASAAVVVEVEGDICRDARIALGAVGPVPLRAAAAEALVRGKSLVGTSATELINEAARLASETSLPIDDIRADARFRRRVVGMLVGRALEEAIALARINRKGAAVRQGRTAQ